MIWLGVLADSFKRTRTFQIELEFANDGFRGEGNTGVPGAGGGGGGIGNKRNPLMAWTPGFEPSPHGWEASALTAA